MRWFVWLVAFCLMAAGVARPPVQFTLDRHDATVEDGSDLATLVSRPQTTFTPDKRTDRRVDPHAAPVSPTVSPVARTMVASSSVHHAGAPAPRCLAHSSRGPPAAS